MIISLVVVLSVSDVLHDSAFQFIATAFLGLICALMGALITVWFDRRRRGKRIVYETISDVPIASVNEHVRDSVTISYNGITVADARVIILRVQSVGLAAISRDDYDDPITFNFPGRRVVSSGVIVAKPDKLIDSTDPAKSLRITTTSIELPRVLFNRRDSVSLGVLAEGSGKITVGGRIVGGTIGKFTPGPRLRKRTIISLVVAALFIGSLLPTGFQTIGAFLDKTCALGSVTLDGSSAFYPVAQSVAQKYKANCFLADIQVYQHNSLSGLQDVEASTIQVADTELPSTALQSQGQSSQDLVDHQAGAIVFTVILNKNIVGVSNLTTEQLQGIYTGSLQNWNQIGGPNLPIVPLGRDSSSGTRATFEKYVLGQQEQLPPENEYERTSQLTRAVETRDGAIGYADLGVVAQSNVNTVLIDGTAAIPGNVESNQYKFWAIEHLYTKGEPDGLASSFIPYLIREATATGTSGAFIKLSDMSQDALASHTS